MIRAVLFDLDRTLLDRDTSFAKFAASQHDRFQTLLNHVGEAVFVDRLVELDARGSVWKDLVYQRLTADLQITDISWEELFADFDSRIAGCYIPFAGMHETLAQLSRDYQLGLITNGKGEFQQRTISTLGIGHHFKAILISESEGVRKPDAEIFRRALQQLQCEPSAAVYVGDHPDTDIRAAKEAGMKAVWKRNGDFAEPLCDGVIDRLDELPSVLGSLCIQG